MHVLVTLFLCLASYANGAKEASNKNIKKLQKRFQKHPKGIHMDSEDYQKYVLTSPKPYHCFIFLTGKPAICPKCAEIQELFSEVSMAYAKDEEADNVFFVIVNVQEENLIARTHAVKMIPIIAYVGDGTLVPDKHESLPFRDDHIYSLSGKAMDPGQLLAWSKSFSKQMHVQLYVSPEDRIKRILTIASIVTVILLTVILGLILVRRHTIIMVITSFVIFFLCLGGTFYNVMEGIVWIGKDRQTGKPDYILSGMRGQYLLEGLFCSALQTLPPIFIIALVRLGTGPVSKVSQMMLFALICICMHGVVFLFKFKGGWYQDPPFFPPSTAASGPVRRDQGNTFWD